MGTIDLSFLPALAGAKQMGLTLEQLNAQLRMTQATAKQTGAIFMQDLARQSQQSGIIFDRYGGVLLDTNKTLKDSIAPVRERTKALKEQDKTIKDLSSHETFLTRRVGWFASSVFFFGAINTATAAVSAIKDVEMGMVEIARVTEDATANFDDMRTELLQLGIDYGRSWEDTQDIALRWAQAGYNVRDSLELTKASLLGLNTAELDAKNATESMIGIMAQWGLESKDLIGVIDLVNKTADDYTVTSQDLVSGLLRSSGAAKIMGMSLEETIATLTVMREASGRTGKEVGKCVAPSRSNPAWKHALNSGKAQGWVILSQAA